MSETVKLIIEIPKDRYTDILRIADVQIVRRMPTLEQVVAHGIPLDDVKAEIQDIYVGYRHGYEIMADVLQILDNIGKGDKE